LGGALLMARPRGVVSVLSGAALALAVVFKVLPLALLPILALRRRGATLGLVALFLVGAVAASLIWLPSSLYPDFVTGLVAVSAGVVPSSFNRSIAAALARWIAGTAETSVTLPLWASAVAGVARVALVSAGLWRAWRARTDEQAWAAGSVVVLDATPLLW